MIVECYSADVYCENANHPYSDVMPITYVGRNKRDTDRQRRRAGWVKVEGRDICPGCVHAKRSGERLIRLLPEGDIAPDIDR